MWRSNATAHRGSGAGSQSIQFCPATAPRGKEHTTRTHQPETGTEQSDRSDLKGRRHRRHLRHRRTSCTICERPINSSDTGCAACSDHPGDAELRYDVVLISLPRGWIRTGNVVEQLRRRGLQDRAEVALFANLPATVLPSLTWEQTKGALTALRTLGAVVRPSASADVPRDAASAAPVEIPSDLGGTTDRLHAS